MSSEAASARLRTIRLRLSPGLEATPTPLAAALGAIVMVMLVPFAIAAYVGIWSRYWADDYCLAGVLADQGYLQSQIYWYTSWTGRYSMMALLGIVQQFGVGSAAVTPALSAAGLVVASTSAAQSVFRPMVRGAPSGAYWLVGLTVMAAVIHTNWDMGQLLFWQTVVMIYPASLITSALLIWILARGRSSPIAPALVAFVSGGFVENLALTQLFVLGLWTLHVWFVRRRADLVPHAVWASGGALCALIVVLLAPGNAARASEFQPAGSIIAALAIAVHAVFAFEVFRFVAWTPLDCAAVLGAGALVGLLAKPFECRQEVWSWWRRCILLCCVGTLLMLLTYLPSAYLTGARPPFRAEVFSRLVLASMAAGVAAGVVRTIELPTPRLRMVAMIVAGCLAVAGSTLFAVDLLHMAPRARSFAAAWDHVATQAADARANGSKQLIITPMEPPFFVLQIGGDSGHWVNTCAARYFKLDSIATHLDPGVS